MILFDDFKKVDLRIGTIIDVAFFEKAKKPAYKLRIDFGPLGILKSSAQITINYTPEKLMNQQVIAVVNFPTKQIANFLSQCLVLGVLEKEGRVVLLQPERAVPNGNLVY